MPRKKKSIRANENDRPSAVESKLQSSLGRIYQIQPSPDIENEYENDKRMENKEYLESNHPDQKKTKLS